MNRIDRLMGIKTHLQAKKNLTVPQIAEQFSISKRTVFRDLRAIREIGVTVSFEPEKGYSVSNNYFLRLVSLTVEEANVLSLAEPLVFCKGQACLRASALTKRYGWGTHHDGEGKVALYAVESEAYKQYSEDAALKHTKGMRSKRA
jgi:predicted DNA-binding transcriptional regulator YafY